MGRPCNLRLALLLGYLACATVGHSGAHGRVFLLDLENGSKGGHEPGFEAATNACMTHGAQVASEADLHHAVLECAFSACSRGWLSGPSVGSTVCSAVQGILRPVDVQLENVTRDNERLGVFCVKDAPCGQPPSFPHSHLQGKTGLELGDEVLYACNQGYRLPDGQIAFSLFCGSCGEWSVQSQHCIKDDPEGHLDYEGKLTDGHHSENPREVHHVSSVPGGTERTNHEEDESTSEPEHERRIVSEAGENEEDSAVLATETPVSQLSQKHIFWFPSEAFQEQKELTLIATDSSVKSPTEDQSHVTVKTSDHQSEAEVILEEHDDPDYDHATDPPSEKSPNPSVGSTEDSWLDVSKEEDKVGGVSTGKAETGRGLEVETVTGHSVVEAFEDATEIHMEKETGSLTGSFVEEHIKEKYNKPEDTKYDGVFYKKGEDKELVKGTTRAGKEGSVGVKDGRVVTYYEEPTAEPTEDDMEKNLYKPKETESEVEPMLDGVTDQPNAVYTKPTTFVQVTQTTTSSEGIALHKQPMIYTPAYSPENISTSQERLGPEHKATPTGLTHLHSTPVFTDDVTNMPTPLIKASWETNDHDYVLEHIPDHDMTGILDDPSEMDRGEDHSLEHQERAGEGACAEDPCRVSGRGPMVAAIIVGIAAAVVGVVLGVWCYKRRQQKSSQYQLNGTNRQTQCIELQQTV